MAKLTRKQTRELESLVSLLHRANRKLYGDRYAVCMVINDPPHVKPRVDQFTREIDDRVLNEVTREYGSEICFYKDVVRRLELFITGPKVTQEGD